MWKYHMLLLCLVFSGVLGAWGCDYTIRCYIDSDPQGAQVYIGGSPTTLIYNGTTPYMREFKGDLPRWESTYYQVRKEGYEDSKVVFKPYEDLCRDRHVKFVLKATGPSPEQISEKQAEQALARERAERERVEKELADLKTKAERDARDAAAAATKQPSPPAPAHRWGVIIGLAQYQHSGKWRLENLRYADNDATGLAEYLKSPQGGDFDNVELLTNAQATAANIRIAIREHLRGVQENDLVLIFWAGHGCPDPHEPQKLYLITHDTDPAHMAATAYGMDEFRRDVANLRASRVMVIADACHSAGISDPTLGIRGPGDNKIVDDLRGIGVAAKADDPAAPMRMIFTSCEAGEVSRESSELGGGHGVFSYYLLRSLEGEADKKENGGDGDGKVTVGEAIEFTRDQVRRFTGNQQHPATAGRFDRGLSMRPAKE